MNKEFESQFSNPTLEHRGYPFWSWNAKLDKDELLSQIDYFSEMGLGGFVIHARTGLDTPYLGEEFMEMVKAVVAKAKHLGMKVILYDEDRWPSGAAGGLVTVEKEHRQRQLVFTPITYEKRQAKYYPNSPVSEDILLLARYDIILENGYLSKYKLLHDGETAEGEIWYAYREVQPGSPWFNNCPYADTLNKKTTEKFLDVTHKAYLNNVGEEFGKTIPSIFTDEPQFIKKHVLGDVRDRQEVILPYTDDLEDTFSAAFGASLIEHFPEVVWELANGEVSAIRYQYHVHISDRFAEAFADTIGEWCNNHGIVFTGHMQAEQSLMSQTAFIGEAMRSYKLFGEPGIDILCSKKEYSTAKQAQSAAHQIGSNGVLSELYGVTNWDFDFRGHKMQGDWQAALGITTRVHHLSWVTMEGDAKRDYPASIFYQSPWYKRYDYIETHFARVNTAMKSGRPSVKVGVIHPVESYWLYFGPYAQTNLMRDRLQAEFDTIIETCIFGLVDFDFISEALLPTQSLVEKKSKFNVGEMNYDVVIVPGCITLRKTTLDRLSAFVDGGGKVIFAGQTPTHIDAFKTDDVATLATKCEVVPFNKGSILVALEPYRQFEVLDVAGARVDNYISQTREDAGGKWIFLANTAGEIVADNPQEAKIKINAKGEFSPIIYDTMTGLSTLCEHTHENGNTQFTHTMNEHDSLLIRLDKCSEPAPSATMLENLSTKSEKYADFKGFVDVTLSEPNVLMLDQAEFSVDGGSWRAREELLKIDDSLRGEFGFPSKTAQIAQPWTLGAADPSKVHSLKLKFEFESDIEVVGALLAIEKPELAKIELNGASISTDAISWYVDTHIKTVSLPSILAGKNRLIVEIPFSPRSCTEWFYILGDFGVTVSGANAKIVAPVRRLAFGDWVPQGLPFYGGNVTYHCPVDFESGEYEIAATKYRAPLLEVGVDSEPPQPIAFAPYLIPLGNLSGQHTINITAYGSRINTFGAVHNCYDHTSWFGPTAWRSSGASYSYEYQLKRCGILKSPVICKIN